MEPIALVCLIVAAVLFAIALTSFAAGFALRLVAGGLLAMVLATLLPAIL